MCSLFVNLHFRNPEHLEIFCSKQQRFIRGESKTTNDSIVLDYNFAIISLVLSLQCLLTWAQIHIYRLKIYAKMCHKIMLKQKL